MKITLKTVNQQQIVTVDGHKHQFPTIREALEFIFNLRKEVA